MISFIKNSLEFFHAATIVFIRRGLNLEHCLSNFRKIWREENEFMCRHLDSRWLVSACDTIIDHFVEEDEVATAMAAVLFMNTIKLYETERLVQKQTRKFDTILQKGVRVALFDGMTAFFVGHGDMIRNMLRRISSRSASRITGPILQELIQRAKTHDTVFKRFRDMHVSEEPRPQGGASKKL